MAPEDERGAALGPEESSLPAVTCTSTDRESQLESVFGQAMVGILQLDLSGRQLMANARFCEILGRSSEELQGLSFQDYTHPEDLVWNQPLFDERLRQGRPFQIEKRYVRPDGSSVWCTVYVSFVHDAEGRPESCIVIAEDITARRAAEQELLRSRNLLQSVIDSVSDLISVKDCSGNFVLTNQALDDGRGKLTGRRFTDAADAKLVAASQGMDRDVIASGEPSSIEELIAIRGQPRMFHTIKVPWRSDEEIAGIIGVSRDITERQETEFALKESEQLNRSIVEATTDCVCLLELGGTTAFVNAAGVAAMEYDDASQLLGKSWLDLWPVELQRTVKQALGRARAGGIARFSEVCRTGKGRYKWWDVVVSPVRGEDGRAMRLVTIARDVTQQKSIEEEVRWAATHDALTSLPNRILFQERLGAALTSAERAGTSVGLLHLDVDHFKDVNDTLGHDAGDELLKAFAQRLKSAVRSGDTVARLGGDEFAVVVPGLRNARDIENVVQSILTRMKEPFVYSDRILDCRASIGASIYPKDGSSPEDLLKSADIALYMAKAAGRGGLMIFRGEMRAEAQKRSSMIAIARMAIQEDRIAPFYQPKVNLRTGAIVGFEALLRWRNHRGGFQAPGLIAAAFEDLELATAMSERMVKLSIADMRRWLDQGLSFGHIAVNAAAAEFRHDNFAERVLEELRQAGVPTSCFELEVTETVFLGRGADHVVRALKLLSAEGVSIALDDFGTGYASLRHLKQFPVDVLKIDQNFVRDLHKPDDAAIIQAVLRLGQSLGIRTVAEGIECASQAQHLFKSGCDYGQGHLYSKALPAARVPRLIREWQSNDLRRSAA